MKLSKVIIGSLMVSMFGISGLINVEAGSQGFVEWTVKAGQGTTRISNRKTTSDALTSIKQNVVGIPDTIVWYTQVYADGYADIANALYASEDDNWHTSYYYNSTYANPGQTIYHVYKAYKWEFTSYVMTGVLDYR